MKLRLGSRTSHSAMAIARGLLLLSTVPVLVLLGLQQLGYGRAIPAPHQVQTQLSAFFPGAAHDFLLLNRPRATLALGLTVVGTTLREGLHTPVDAFRGIPYALPPVGDRRFRRAVPLNESSDGRGLLDASRFGSRCPGKQLLSVTGDTGSSEDCLTVNVFRPRVQQGKLPVAVYVHGGAYNRGTASMHNTPSMVGWSAEPFVAISFNYRIGALGFLPSSITADEGLLNLGLHDQLLLLQWVQDNVERFGGDPSQVTLFGLSAGAHSIAHHITNPALTNLTHNRLFHRAIIESGSALSRAVHPPNAQLHEDQFHAFVAQAGCPRASTPDIMPCLRRQPSSTITAAQLAVFDHWNPSVRWAFQPVIDGELIMRPPIETWRSQSSSQNANSKTWTWTWPSLPILTGFNSNEGTYYVPCSLNTSDSFAAFFRSLLPAYSDADIATIEALYPDPAEDKTSPYTETRENLDIGTQFKRVEAAYGHYAYACPVRLTARLAAQRQGQGQDAPVFLYRWALNKTVLGGANHGDQMEYETFDARVRGISRAQEEVAGDFHAYLTSFIVTGDPNAVKGIDRPVWERYEGDGRIMVFGEGNDERAGGEGVGVAAQMSEDDWGRRECAFWWEKAGISD